MLFEGFLGKIREIVLVEDAMLEFNCENGILRIDLSRGELEKVLAPKKKAS